MHAVEEERKSPKSVITEKMSICGCSSFVCAKRSLFKFFLFSYLIFTYKLILT